MSKIALSGDASGTGTFTIASPNSNSNFTLTLPAATGTVVASGTTPSLNGITFPATQVASADANTLDDYEEGTWTPSWTAGSGSMTVSSTSAAYVKIGKTVHIYGFVAISAASAAATLNMSGLPFTASNTPGVRQTILAREDQSTGKMGQLYLNNNATTGALQDYTGSTSVINPNWTWIFNGVYQST
jgi:hypothetical protein